MTQPDKLLSKKERDDLAMKAFFNKDFDSAYALYKDTMRENERLRNALEKISEDRILSLKTGGGTLPTQAAQIALDALTPNKHSDDDSPQARRIKRKLERIKP